MQHGTPPKRLLLKPMTWNGLTTVASPSTSHTTEGWCRNSRPGGISYLPPPPGLCVTGRARELRRFAERLSAACMQDAGLAYCYLTTLEKDRLPETLQMGRVSTVGWRFNTRFQAARAAILKALILMATDKPNETELAMAALYYREASTVASSASQICLLTQVALTYALLTGGRFLAPGDRLDNVLPPHITTPWSSDGHLFDLETASMYLSDHQFTARVMATLSWPAARIAMRRVEPPEIYPAWQANWSAGSRGDLSRRSKMIPRQ